MSVLHVYLVAGVGASCNPVSVQFLTNVVRFVKTTFEFELLKLFFRKSVNDKHLLFFEL